MRWAAVLLPVVLTVFFLSGFSSLVYQVVWVKLLTHVFGVTTYAVSAVLGAFMGGLALGSYLGGRLADRRVNSLRLYAGVEIGIAVCALTLPALIEGLTPLYQVLYLSLERSLYLLSLVRFGLSFLLLLLPTTLMGATLPILIPALVSDLAELGNKVARLYTWNTLGAVVGSLAAGLLLIGLFGLRITTIVAAGFNLLAGLTLLGFAARLPAGRHPAAPRPAEAAPSAPPTSSVPTHRRWLAPARATLALMFLSGFAALGFEVIWTRFLTLVSDHSVYAFSAMVAFVLLGIGLGSQWIGIKAPRLSDPLRALIAAEAALGLSAALLLLATTWGVRFVQPASATIGPGQVSGSPSFFVVIALILTLIPSLCMGMTFPLATLVYARQAGRLGQSVGETYSANVLGAMLGSVLTGLVLIPALGSQRSLLALAVVNLLAALLLALTARRAAASRGVGLTTVALVLITVLVPGDLNRSLFASLYPTLQVAQNFEGAEATVTVARYGPDQIIFLNGGHEANTGAAMLSLHRLIGHFAAFIHPNVQQGLVIGLGGGATSGALARHAQARLDIVELSEGMALAAQEFSPHNGQVLSQPRVRLRVEDGRNYLLLTRGQYDVITADTIYALRAYSSNVYSVEYYRLAAERLAPGGVMVQWLDTSLQEHEQQIMIRTFAQAFPHAGLWQKGTTTLLLGSNQPIRPDPAVVRDGLTDSVLAEVALMGIRGADDILAGFGPADDVLRQRLGPGLILTDDHPYNEYFRLLRLAGLWRWLE